MTARRLFFGALLGLGLTLMSLGITHYASPLTQLAMNGSSLALFFSPTATWTGLVGDQATLQTWTEQNGALDSPLPDQRVSETGSVLLSIPRADGAWTLAPREWIQLGGALPLSHPSLAPATLRMNQQTMTVHRDDPGSARLGRAAVFLFPEWPARTVGPESSWQEDASWAQTVGDWQLLWKGVLTWHLNAFTECGDDGFCAQLAYEAVMIPAWMQGPAWSAGLAAPKGFQGRGAGEGSVVYSITKRRLLANTFHYTGEFSVPLKAMEQVPEDLRIGRLLTTGPGTLAGRLHGTFTASWTPSSAPTAGER